MNKDFEILKHDLSAIGIKAGDSILIHSSYKSMGGLEGGIKTFADAVLSVIGDSGTLIAPTLTYRDVSEENPVYDHVKTPSCVGAISEYIRNMDGSIRSIHPTHSCAAIGGRADYFTCSHYMDCTPVGENSPFFKLKEDGGKILMLGCSLRSNTSMHGVEEAFRTSYVLPDKPSPYTIILPDRTYTIDFYRHHIHQNGFDQRYDRVADILDKRYMPEGNVHGAHSYLIDAAALWKYALKTLEKDEFFFVDKQDQ